MPRYRIFLSPNGNEDLPAGVEIEERYPAFLIISASETIISELRNRFTVIKLGEQEQTESAPDDGNLVMDSGVDRNDMQKYFIVTFRAPTREIWLKELANIGATIHSPIDSSTVIVSLLDEGMLAQIKAIEAVEKVKLYVPILHIKSEFLQNFTEDVTEESIIEARRKIERGEIVPAKTSNLTLPQTLIADFFTEQECSLAQERLSDLGFQVSRVSNLNRLIISLSPLNNSMEALQEILQQPGLSLLEEKKISKLRNNIARNIIGRNVVAGTLPTSLNLSGQGEVVAIADSGIDTGDKSTIHLDLRGRVKAILSYPIPPSLSGSVTNPGDDDGAADKNNGHGTHVAGSVLGDGARAEELGIPAIQGMAPEAQLVFQAIEQSPQWTFLAQLSFLQKGIDPPTSGLFGIPDNLEDLFQDAYDRGARIHTNSWGGGEPGVYDSQCADLDRFVWNNRDLLIVVAAGNAGRHTNSAIRGIDQGSIDSPGTAKNCLTVGACENDRSQQFSVTYGMWREEDFSNPPFQGDTMAGSIDDIAAFSSRGPCATGRRKPDVVAPGTFVLSTRSSQIAADNFAWAEFPSAKQDYMYMGGTSMAAPLAAGAAALVRQFLRQQQGISNPSAALLKATLIQSADYLDYRFSHPASSKWSDNEQGWGRINLQNVLNPQLPVKVIFIDESFGLETGAFQDYSVNISETIAPLRVTFVYSDFPGESLVNDLNLFIFAPDNTSYIGNDFDNTDIPDSLNNVEGIVVDTPDPGIWTVRVIASSVVKGSQRFSIVISGGGAELI